MGVSGTVLQVQLFPRRKQGDITESKPERGRAPVVINVEEISALFRLPQGEAASSLGLSLTAFKKTCRNLGVARWPYLRPAKKRKVKQAITPTTVSSETDEDAQKVTAHDSSDLCWLVAAPAENCQDISDEYSSDDLGWLVGAPIMQPKQPDHAKDSDMPFQGNFMQDSCLVALVAEAGKLTSRRQGRNCEREDSSVFDSTQRQPGQPCQIFSSSPQLVVGTHHSNNSVHQSHQNTFQHIIGGETGGGAGGGAAAGDVQISISPTNANGNNTTGIIWDAFADDVREELLGGVASQYLGLDDDANSYLGLGSDDDDTMIDQDGSPMNKQGVRDADA